MIESARRAGWRHPNDDLVKRVEERSPNPLDVATSPLRELEMNDAPSPDVRSGAAGLAPSEGELFGSFEGGEVACLIEEGALLGSWVVRGTVWLSDPSSGSMSLEWIDDDHVLSSITLASGEPFGMEEVASGGWHLELRLGDGRAFVLRPAMSSGGGDDSPL